MKPLLRLLAVILVFASLFAVYGCQETPADNQETQGEQKTEKAPFDPEHPHLLLATDIRHGHIAVIDLDAEDPMDPASYYWHWKPETAKGWKYGFSSLSDARLRWSEAHQSYVVLMTAASGWIGIAEYPSGTCIWETKYTGTSPHAMEMLPNGDLVVANSGGNRWEREGTLKYYQMTYEKRWTCTDTIELPSAHGVLWDPTYNVLWADGFDSLLAYDIITKDGGKPGLSQRSDGMGTMLISGNGHDLMPDYADPNFLWITCDKSVVKYNKAADKEIRDYSYSDMLYGKYRVKGITSFSDGTVAYAQCGATSSEWLNTFCVLWPRDSEGREADEVLYTAQDGAYWNKVRNFDPDYQ